MAVFVLLHIKSAKVAFMCKMHENMKTSELACIVTLFEQIAMSNMIMMVLRPGSMVLGRL